jgi:hypothetical protein
MLAGIKYSAIKVHNDFICDGHHLYVASLFANYDIEVIIWVTNTTITLIDWNTVSFDERDWDTEYEINIRNRQDAEYNNIPIEKIIEILQ